MRILIENVVKKFDFKRGRIQSSMFGGISLIPPPPGFVSDFKSDLELSIGDFHFMFIVV